MIDVSSSPIGCFYRNNICITREEIDENAPSTPKPDDDDDVADDTGIKDIEIEVPLGDISDADDDEDDVAEFEEVTAAAAADPMKPTASRLKRQFSFNSTLRISSCSDKGLSYVCETKCQSTIESKKKKFQKLMSFYFLFFFLNNAECGRIKYARRT